MFSPTRLHNPKRCLAGSLVIDMTGSLVSDLAGGLVEDLAGSLVIELAGSLAGYVLAYRCELSSSLSEPCLRVKYVVN